MLNFYKKVGLLAFILILTISMANAQNFYPIWAERSLMAIGGLGTSTYFGELANPGDYIDEKPALSAGIQYYFTNRIGLRAEAVWFQLSGDDVEADIESGRRERNLSFTSNNFELSATGLFNFYPQGKRFYQRPGFNVYGFAGIGFIYFNPKTKYQGKTYALQPLQTELKKYSRLGIVIPFGIGARIKVGAFFNISLEGGYRKTFTDYLDDVSTVHRDQALFRDPVAAALTDRRPELGLENAPDGTQRGNPDNDDGYFLMTIKIGYYLPIKFFAKGLYQNKPNRHKRNLYYKFKR